MAARIRLRQPELLAKLAEELSDEIGYHTFVQWVFWEQWEALKRHAGEKGIQIIGDVPIFVAEDSADVWANPEQFKLDAEGNPTVIAGVPPDLFSATGQRWGNPHYNWEQMRHDGFRWWINRIQQTLRVRRHRARRSLPRLRGRVGDSGGRGDGGQGQVGEGARTRALRGRAERRSGDLPFIAEDLGVITPDVDALRAGVRLARDEGPAVCLR